MLGTNLLMARSKIFTQKRRKKRRTPIPFQKEGMPKYLLRFRENFLTLSKQMSNFSPKKHISVTKKYKHTEAPTHTYTHTQK